MNKYIASLIFLTHTVFFTQASPSHSFEKLLPTIAKEATVWTESVINTLNDDLSLAFLNLFALNSEKSIEAFMKCAEYIEAEEKMKQAYEALSFNIIEKIRKYVDNVQTKIAQKKNITQQEEKKILQKLEAKIQELVSYINSIYYNTLYKALSKKTSSHPLCMFDKNGIIPKENRTTALPSTL